MAEEKVISKDNETLDGNVNIHCFVCGAKVSVEGEVPGANVNCQSCDTKLTVPDKDVLMKLASFESFTETPSVSQLNEAKDDKKSEHKIFCDGCGAKIDVSDQPVGSRFSCPACGMVIRVPVKASPEKSAAKSDSPNKKTEEKSKFSSKKSAPKEKSKDNSSKAEGSASPSKLKINCHTCGAKIDVTEEKPFEKVNCPACNAVFQIPKRFSHFLLEERLGENDHFSVYRALDLTLSREVCLKVMSKELSANDHMVEKFLAVAGKTALVNDPNIVPIYSSGEFEGCSFLVMQYMAASSLEPYLEKAKGLLPINSVYRCMKDATKGLEAAFKQGLNHNNVSMRNILVDREGNIKVADFGYSYALFNLDKDDKVTSYFNPLYLSLETAKTGKSDLAADIYSLGSVFYHLITGVPPFPGDKPEEVIKQRLERKPVAANKVRSEIPEDVSEFIGRLMSDVPSERPSSFAEIIKKIESFQFTTTANNVPKPVAAISGGSAALLVDAKVEGEDSATKANKPPIAVILAAALVALVLVVFLLLPPKDKPVETVDAPPSVGEVEPGPIEDPAVDVLVPEISDADSPLLKRGYAVKVNMRPHPAGISFRPYTDQIIEYMDLHQGDAYDHEASRIKILRKTKPYLEGLLRYVPYKGNLYIKGKSVISGEIVGVSVKSLTIKANGADLELSWNKFDTRQFLDIIEFYIQLKKAQIEDSPSEVSDEVKKDMADDYFRAALISDWYGETEKLDEYMKNSLLYNPSLRPQIETFLPSISE